jgi:hypothetical protein
MKPAAPSFKSRNYPPQREWKMALTNKDEWYKVWRLARNLPQYDQVQLVTMLLSDLLPKRPEKTVEEKAEEAWEKFSPEEREALQKYLQSKEEVK